MASRRPRNQVHPRIRRPASPLGRARAARTPHDDASSDGVLGRLRRLGHYLLSIAGLYATAQDYIRFAQMLANRGTLDGVRMLSPSSVKLMTTNLLPAGVPLQFIQPFTGQGYGMNVGIVLDPSHADFNGGANGAGTFFWCGVHGTWFWVDPVNDIVVVGMLQQQDAGNPMTGRPYPVADVAGLTRSVTYGALVDPAL